MPPTPENTQLENEFSVHDSRDPISKPFEAEEITEPENEKPRTTDSLADIVKPAASAAPPDAPPALPLAPPLPLADPDS